MRSLDFPLILSLPMRFWVGVRKPRANTIPGTELAGVIEAVGNEVQRFSVGDEVYGAAGMSFGTNAEYITLSEDPGETEGGFALKPANMSFEEAATVPFGARDALHFLRLGNLQRGDKLLINGAGGSIGTFAVQLAKLDGVAVTAVDSTPKLEMLRSIGADHVVDYTQEDFTAQDQIYDVIFDVVGTVKFSKGNRVLKEGGTYLLANPVSQMMSALWTRLTTNRKVEMATSNPTTTDLATLRDLIEGGNLRTVIDRTYPLEEIVEAHKYVEAGGKLGNVVITV